MAFWGGMGGGNWGGGNWQWNQGPPQGGNQQRERRGKDGQLRRSVDAWDEEELGAAYNHDVVMRLMGYIKPYKLRAFMAIAGVLGWAIFQPLEPVFIGKVLDAAIDGDAAGATRNGLIFLGLVLGPGLLKRVSFCTSPDHIHHPGSRVRPNDTTEAV